MFINHTEEILSMQPRRVFLASIAATTTTLAGCSGGDSESNMTTTSTGTDSAATPTTEAADSTTIDTVAGPGKLAIYDTSWTAETQLTVNTPTRVELVIGNRGGEPITLDGSFVAEALDADPDQGYGSTLPEATLSAELAPNSVTLESGDTVTVTTGDVTPLYAGDYQPTVQLSSADDERLSTAPDRDTTLTAAPHTGTTSEFVTIENDVEMAVDSVQFEQGLHYETRSLDTQDYTNTYDERVGLLQTLPDQTLVVITATIRNGTGRQTELDANRALTFNGTAVPEDTISKTFTGLDTPPLRTTTIPPGATETGHLIFRVDREGISDSTLGASLDPNSRIAETQIDIDLADASFPRFSLESVDRPDTFSGGDEEDTFRFAISNNGDGAGRVRAAIQWRDTDADEYDNLLSGNDGLEASIPPGETHELTITTTGRTEATTYRIIPFNERFSVSPES